MGLDDESSGTPRREHERTVERGSDSSSVRLLGEQALFAEYFIGSILSRTGYPKTKGLRRTKYVEVAMLDSTTIQLSRLGVTVGVHDAQTAGRLLSDTWDFPETSPATLFSNYDPSGDIAAHPELPPWVAFSKTMGIGPNGGQRPDGHLYWEDLAEATLTAMFAVSLTRGLIWGLSHTDIARTALEHDVGLEGGTRTFLTKYSIDIIPTESLQDLAEHSIAVINSYAEYKGSIPDVDQELQDYLDHLR